MDNEIFDNIRFSLGFLMIPVVFIVWLVIIVSVLGTLLR
jgi:hypothetical protein